MATSKKVVTPVGIASYANLLEPKPQKSNDGKTKLMYSVSLLISKTRALEVEAIKKAALEVAIAKWGPKGANILAAAKYPIIRDGDKMLDEDTGKTKAGYEGMFVIQCKSNRKPQIIDAAKNEVFTEEDCYSGCSIRLQGSVFPYEAEGNKGVTFWFDNVQVVKKGPRLDGRKAATEVFEEWKDPEAATGTDGDLA